MPEFVLFYSTNVGLQRPILI